jgi:hypothetical protein
MGSPPPPPGPPNPAAMGVGMGAPPGMPGLPPPPTGQGAIPLGNPGNDKKAAADQTILNLRELSGHYPALKSMLDSTVDAIKAASSIPAAPQPPPGTPNLPGAPEAEPTSLEDSGSSGGM